MQHSIIEQSSSINDRFIPFQSSSFLDTAALFEKDRGSPVQLLQSEPTTALIAGETATRRRQEVAVAETCIHASHLSIEDCSLKEQYSVHSCINERRSI